MSYKTRISHLWARRNLAFGLMMMSSIFLLLCISLVPLKFSARSQIKITPIHTLDEQNPFATLSEKEIVYYIQSTELTLIRQTLVRECFDHLELIKNPEYNRSHDPKYAKTTQLLDWLQGRHFTKGQNEHIKDMIIDDINKNLTITIDNEFLLNIEYQAPYPHIAKAFVNLLSEKYIENPHQFISKLSIKKADLPESFSTPNLLNALYFTVLISFIVGIVGVLIIKPKNLTS